MTNRSKKVNFRSFTAVESFVCHRLKAKPHGWLVSLEQLRQCYFPTAVSEDPANCSKYHHRDMYKDCQAFSNVDSNILIMSAKHQENDTPVKASHLLLVIAVCQVLVPEHCLLGEPPKHEKFVSFHKSSVEWWPFVTYPAPQSRSTTV